MQYFGGKYKLAKYIVPVLEAYRKRDQLFIDGSCGGINILSNMSGCKAGLDINEDLIILYQELQKETVVLPSSITEEDYLYYKNLEANSLEEKALKAFVGFGCSFGGRYYGGYARYPQKPLYNYADVARRSLLKKIKKCSVSDTEFFHLDLFDLHIEDALIYFDPPYIDKVNTNKGIFDSERFWKKVRELSKDNTVIVSELSAPEDFSTLWSRESCTKINNTHYATNEKLFSYNSNLIK